MRINPAQHPMVQKTPVNFEGRKANNGHAAPKFGMDPGSLADPSLWGTIFGVGGALTGVGILVKKGFHIIDQAEEALVQTLGRYTGKRKAGPTVIVPGVQKLTKVSKKEDILDLPQQEVITKDNVTMKVDGVVYYKIVDAEKAVFGVEDYREAIRQLAQPTIRELIGEMTLDESLGAQASLSKKLLELLDNTTNTNWGIDITRVKLQNINPPKEVQEAMEKQVTAERKRRADVITAEGERQSAILKSEGMKQAAINTAEGKKASDILNAEAEKTSRVLKAEADKQVTILNSEGDKEAALRRAEGEAAAIQMVGTKEAEMAKLKLRSMVEAGATPEVVALEYIKMFPELAKGDGTIVVPHDLGGLIGTVQAVLGTSKGLPKPSAPAGPAAPEVDKK